MNELPAFFSSARHEIEPILASVGFCLATLHYDPEAFGSSYTEYTRRGGRFRLVWDGKEEALYGVVRGDVGEWQDVEAAMPTPTRPFDKDTSPERLARLAAAVQSFYRAK